MTDDSNTFKVCPYCDERVEPDEPGVTYAVKPLRMDTLGGSSYVDGLGGYFHPGCSPGAIGWAPRDDPRR
jgi:hypothetical protein